MNNTGKVGLEQWFDYIEATHSKKRKAKQGSGDKWISQLLSTMETNVNVVLQEREKATKEKEENAEGSGTDDAGVDSGSDSEEADSDASDPEEAAEEASAEEAEPAKSDSDSDDSAAIEASMSGGGASGLTKEEQAEMKFVSELKHVFKIVATAFAHTDSDGVDVITQACCAVLCCARPKCLPRRLV